MNGLGDLGALLIDLARTDSNFVVIGSSALAMHGWDVAPGDLDLMVEPGEVESIVRAFGVPAERQSWVAEGQARRLECQTARGPVDLYTDVSGGMTFADVVRDSATVQLEEGGQRVMVGSLTHIRDMRAAAGRSPSPVDVTPGIEHEETMRIIAIDGPAGAGKSTVSHAVAEELGFTYLNTGAMYRCVALRVLAARADTDDHEEIGRIASEAEIEFRDGRVVLDGDDVSEVIRAQDVTDVTSHIAAYPEVREAMIQRQRRLFADGGFVAEGRDTGTVVAPEAPLKIFLTASLDERARRRAAESGEDMARVKSALEKRDRSDSQRALSALRRADDGIEVDTTGRAVPDVVDEIVSLARQRGV
jgi:CMP/dCMP kinase